LTIRSLLSFVIETAESIVEWNVQKQQQPISFY